MEVFPDSDIDWCCQLYQCNDHRCVYEKNGTCGFGKCRYDKTADPRDADV